MALIEVLFGKEITKIGEGTGTATFDVSTFSSDFKLLTVDNFLIDLKTMQLSGTHEAGWSVDYQFYNSPCKFSKIYNQNTGKLVLTFGLHIYTNSSLYTASIGQSYNVYLIDNYSIKYKDE